MTYRAINRDAQLRRKNLLSARSVALREVTTHLGKVHITSGLAWAHEANPYFSKEERRAIDKEIARIQNRLLFELARTERELGV